MSNKCPTCPNSDSRTYSDDKEWLHHLISLEHQSNVRQVYETWTDEANERSLVVMEWPLDALEPLIGLLEYFSEFGMISDFMIPEHKRYFIVQYKDSDGVKKHLNATTANDRVIIKTKMEISAGELSTLTVPFPPLEVQLTEFLKETELNEEELRKRQRALDDLKEVLVRRFPKCVLNPFGSYITDLGDSSSDIDVYLNVNDKGAQNHPKGICGAVRAYFLKYSHTDFSRFHYGGWVYNARIPIVQIEHRATQIKFDLSFLNMTSVHNSELIKFYTTLDPRVKPLLLIIRRWGKIHDLIGSLSLKSYAVNLLVLTFLAKKKIIPSVYELQKNVPGNYIDGWNCAFDNKVTGNVSQKMDKYAARSVLELTLEFFQTYLNLDATNSVVSLLAGDLFSRQDFRMHGLPTEFDYYQNYIDETPGARAVDIGDPAFCIQDPFVLNFNVSRGTPIDVYLRFKIAAGLTIKKLGEMITGYDLHRIFLDTTPHLRVELPKGKPQRKAHHAANEQMLEDLIQELDYLPRAQFAAWSIIATPSEEFKSMFRGHFVDLPGKLPVNRKGKSLWTTFMRDLIHEFLNAFLLNVSVVEFQAESDAASNEPNSSKRKRSRSPNEVMNTNTANKSKRGRTDDSTAAAGVDQTKIGWLKNKLDNISEKQPQDFALHCTGNYPIWENRAGIYETLMIPEPGAELCNPLEIEKEISEIVQKRHFGDQNSTENGVTNQSPPPDLFKFECQVKFNTQFTSGISIEITFRALALDETATGEYVGRAVQYAIPCLESLLKNAIPKYLEFRFKSWMEGKKPKSLQ